jgi:hypothetical protein
MALDLRSSYAIVLNGRKTTGRKTDIRSYCVEVSHEEVRKSLSALVGLLSGSSEESEDEKFARQCEMFAVEEAKDYYRKDAEGMPDDPDNVMNAMPPMREPDKITEKDSKIWRLTF